MSASGKLVALVGLGVVLAMVVSTGAFDTVAAERTTDVSVVGDSQAVVQLVPYTGAGGQQSQLASVVDGTLQIALNVDAAVDARNVFNVTNHGTQPVAVWIVDVDHPGDVAGGTDRNDTAAVTFYNPDVGGASSTENGLPSVEGRENAVELGVGETLTVSLYVDTTSVDDGEVDVLDEMLVYADADVEGATGSSDGPDGGTGDGGSGDASIHPLPNQQLTIPSAVGEKTLRIGNLGSDTLAVTDLRIVGADADEFEIRSGDAPFTVAPGTGVQPTHAIVIAYTGSGHATAQLEISSNDPDEPVRVVALKGTGPDNPGNGPGGDDD